MSDRLTTLSRFRIDRDDFVAAAGFIIFGLASKVLLADGLDYYIGDMALTPGALSPVDGYYVVFAYSFQIYFDFYGYSLIAIGIGRIFGFNFPDNFLRPYEALNPRDFWRRWHVTLSYWIRDYLYMPLGGNRRYVRNVVIVFGVCGLWHGAGLTFVVWGLYHGALVVVYRMTSGVWNRMPKLVQWALNFTLVSLGWILFLFVFEGVRALTSSLLGQSAGNSEIQTTISSWGMLAIAAATCFFMNYETMIHIPGARPIMVQAYSTGLAGLFLLSLLFVVASNDFIYFRF